MSDGVYLGLGSNIGDREYYLKKALRMLNNNEYIIVKDVSSVYETEPVGYLAQDRFLNIVILIETTLKPYELLNYIHSVEKGLDRKRDIHWGPRTIDIDILLFNDFTMNEENLIIPHSQMFNRAFVLIPLNEIYNGSDYREMIEDALGNVEAKDTVNRYILKDDFIKSID